MIGIVPAFSSDHNTFALKVMAEGTREMKVETYEIDGWENSETGLLVKENEDWILVRHIPVDYMIDGYRLYKKEFIEKRIRTKKEKQIERVLGLKQVEVKGPNNFGFGDTIGLLEWVEKKYELFEFQDDDETELFLWENKKCES